jgi:hypothetical protein
MDVVMPGLNGFQATRAITREEKTKHIPVIICTTKDQRPTRSGPAPGAKDRIAGERAELIDKIKALGNAWHGAPASRVPASVAERLHGDHWRGARVAAGFQVGGENWPGGAAPGERSGPRRDGDRAAHAAVVPRRQRARQPYSLVDFAAFQGVN